MFSSKKAIVAKPTRPVAQIPDKAVTILTSGCHFKGKLYCRGSSRIGGKIEGQIVSEGLLIVEEGAFINGEIVAEEAIIQGQVVGKLEARTRVELTTAARFEGDIMTPALCVHEGAQFNGKSTMLNSDADAKVKNTRVERGMNEKSPNASPGADIVKMKLPEVNVHS